MIKGIYTSASAMIPGQRKQEIIANNLSNVRTTGYKKDASFVRELQRAERKTAPARTEWQTPLTDETYVDFAPGIFDKTDNPLDLAVEGDGFFTLRDQDGATYLTRAGAFEVDSDGMMVFPGGLLLLSEGAAIEVGNGEVSVGLTGEVEVDGLRAGRIVPMTVDNLNDLVKVGRSLFQVPEGVELRAANAPVIRQGYLETANVDIVREMVDMMIAFRIFEANSKAIQSQDGSLDHLFNRVGSKS
jgi:flagellar basal-body rod protein FlgG